MKSNAGWIVVVAAVLGMGLNHATQAAAGQKTSDAMARMSPYEAEQRAAAKGREKDNVWTPACSEVGLIQIGNRQRPGALKNFCLDAEGNLLACFAPQTGAEGAPGIRVYSPKGNLLRTLPLEIKPAAICIAKDGSIFVAGDGRVFRLDPAGKVLASAQSPVARQRADVTGLAATGQDVFMAVPSPSDFGFQVYRFTQALEEPKLVVDKLRGCCGQMDIQARDGKLWIAHNARHAVESRDRDGNELASFGKAGRVKAADFGGCCEPKNLRVLPNGDILAAESGPPTCIKRFSPDGKFQGVVAVVAGAKGDCVRVTVEMSPDGRRYYLLDTSRDAIRVFEAKS